MKKRIVTFVIIFVFLLSGCKENDSEPVRKERKEIEKYDPYTEAYENDKGSIDGEISLEGKNTVGEESGDSQDLHPDSEVPVGTGANPGNNTEGGKKEDIHKDDSVVNSEGNSDIDENFPKEGKDSEKETQDSQVTVQKNFAEAYSAYRDIIRKEKKLIDKYTWQQGYYGYGVMAENELSRPVAFADVYGDDTPELIYFRYNDSYGYDYADMHIVTYEDGKSKSIFDGFADSCVAGGTNYYLFQRKGDKALYIFDYFSEEYWEESYYALEDNGSGLSRVEKYKVHAFYQPSGDDLVEIREYTKNKNDICTENEYNKAVSSFQTEISSIIMHTKLYKGFAKEFLDKNGCQAMTSDEALAFLKEKIDGSSKDKSNSISSLEAYRDFVLDQAFMNMGNPKLDYEEYAKEYGYIGFSLYDMDGDNEPELLIYNGYSHEMSANYVFTYKNGEITYCGNTSPSGYSVENYQGLFSSNHYVAYHAEPYLYTYYGSKATDQYDEVEFLNYFTLDGIELVKEKVYDKGYIRGSDEWEFLYMTDDEGLYAASQNTHKKFPSMSWKEITETEDGWNAFVDSYMEFISAYNESVSVNIS